MYDYDIPRDMPDYIDGELTFMGVVHSFWAQLSVFWNDDTQRNYYGDYLLQIAPYFKSQALIYYDDTVYYEDVINSIRKNGPHKKKEEEYSESTMNHYRHLIRHVIRTAAKNGIIPDILWGSGFHFPGDSDDPQIVGIAVRTQLQRSFTPAQEYRLSDIIFKDPLMPGSYVAAFLMWVFGLRNKEACGLVWGDIHSMPEHPECYVLAVYSSTIESSSESHTGGKTKNMFRFLPIPSLVHQFLIQRKLYIQDEINAGRILLNDSITSIDRIPIASSPKNWIVSCNSNQVTSTCRQIFHDAGLHEKDLVYFSAEPDESDVLGVISWDADPTAYTNRRNFATHLGLLGFSLEEIQYLMGHQSTNTDYKRNHFANPDMLYQLYQKMTQRPIVNAICNDSNTIEIASSLCHESFGTNTFRVYGSDCVCQIRLISHSPLHPGKITVKPVSSISEDIPIKCTYTHQSSLMHPPVQISALSKYHQSYLRELRKREKTE